MSLSLNAFKLLKTLNVIKHSECVAQLVKNLPAMRETWV